MTRSSPGYLHYSGDFRSYDGQYLPHWDVEDGLYFVTFRLADSLPAGVAHELSEKYKRELETLVADHDPPTDILDDFRLKFYLTEVDPRLDNHHGACHLQRPEVAQMVRDSLTHFDGERFALFAWTLMPNHVHVQFGRRPGHTLGDVVGGWKSHTAHAARDLVDFGDHFWQADYLDRLIRSEEEFWNVAKYITENAQAAGLEDWPWQEFVRAPGENK